MRCDLCIAMGVCEIRAVRVGDDVHTDAHTDERWVVLVISLLLERP